MCQALREAGACVHAAISPWCNAWRLEDAVGIRRHAVDLRDRNAVQKLIAEVRPTVVFNLASHGAYPFQTDATRIVETNVLGLTYLLHACDDIGYRLFVHTGSSSEYGRKSVPMREDDELAPESVYGVSKAAQSLLCRQWAQQHHRPLVVFRLFSAYGPFEEPTRLIPRLITAMLDDAPLAMVSPDISRDFVYVDDVVTALLKVGEHDPAVFSGAILNLGSGIQTSLGTLVTTLESLSGTSFKAEWNTMPSRPWDTDQWVADTTRLERTLGWTPSVTVREGLERSIEWFRSYRRFYPRT